MTERDDAQSPAPAGGAYDFAGWGGGDGPATLTATGQTAEDVLLAGLAGVAEAAGARAVAEEDAATAAAIRGQGADVPAVFAELAADLLAQLDANGPGLGRVRLDGVLETDDGFTAWGYALGAALPNPPPIGVALDGNPTLDAESGRLVLRCRLRRAGTAG